MKINKKVVILSGLIIVSSIYFHLFPKYQRFIPLEIFLFTYLESRGYRLFFTSPINYETFNYTGYGVNYYPFLAFSSCNVVLMQEKFDCKLYYLRLGIELVYNIPIIIMASGF